MITTIWKKTTAAVFWIIAGIFAFIAWATHHEKHRGRHATQDDGQDWADVLRKIPSPLRRRKVSVAAVAATRVQALAAVLDAKRPEIEAVIRPDRPSHADLDQYLTDDALRYPARFDGDFPVLDGDLLPPLDGIRIDAPMTYRPEPPLRPLPPARACPDVDAGRVLDGLDRHFSAGLSLSPAQLTRHKAAGTCAECAGLEPWREPRQHYATGLCWCGNCHDQAVSSVAEATARLREAVVHYSTDANRPCTAADVRIACGAAHWAIVSDDPDRVTCTDCHVALIPEDVPGPAETASPPPPSGNGAEAATSEAVASAGPGTTKPDVTDLDDTGWLPALIDWGRNAPLDQVTAAAR